MKTYKGIPSSKNIFVLKQEEYKKFYFEFINPFIANPIIKYKKHYLKLKRKNEFLCENCFFKTDTRCKGKCVISDLIGNMDDWNYYIFEEVEEYEVVFGGNNYEKKI